MSFPVRIAEAEDEYSAGNFVEAARLYETAVAGAEDLIGDEDLLKIRDQWAKSLDKSKQHKAAAACNYDSFQKRLKTPGMGISHPSTLENLRRLGGNYANCQNLDKAEKYYRVVFDTLKVSVISKKHTAIQHCEDAHRLCKVLFQTENMGKIAESIDVALNAISTTEKVLGNDHTKIIKLRWTLGEEFSKLQKHEEALSQYRLVITLARNTTDGQAEIARLKQKSIQRAEMCQFKLNPILFTQQKNHNIQTMRTATGSLPGHYRSSEPNGNISGVGEVDPNNASLGNSAIFERTSSHRPVRLTSHSEDNKALSPNPAAPKKRLNGRVLQNATRDGTQSLPAMETASARVIGKVESKGARPDLRHMSPTENRSSEHDGAFAISTQRRRTQTNAEGGSARPETTRTTSGWKNSQPHSIASQDHALLKPGLETGEAFATTPTPLPPSSQSDLRAISSGPTMSQRLQHDTQRSASARLDLSVAPSQVDDVKSRRSSAMSLNEMDSQTNVSLECSRSSIDRPSKALLPNLSRDTSLQKLQRLHTDSKSSDQVPRPSSEPRASLTQAAASMKVNAEVSESADNSALQFDRSQHNITQAGKKSLNRPMNCAHSVEFRRTPDSVHEIDSQVHGIHKSASGTLEPPSRTSDTIHVRPAGTPFDELAPNERKVWNTLPEANGDHQQRVNSTSDSQRDHRIRNSSLSPMDRSTFDETRAPDVCGIVHSVKMSGNTRPVENPSADHIDIPGSWRPDFDHALSMDTLLSRTIPGSQNGSFLGPLTSWLSSGQENEFRPKSTPPTRHIQHDLTQSPPRLETVGEPRHVQTDADAWLINVGVGVHTVLNQYPEFEGRRRNERIKIALLDTGVSRESNLDGAIRHMAEGMDQNVKTGRKLSNKLPPNKDDDGHGTDCAYLLWKVCPYADIFPYRICSGAKDDIDPSIVGEAIEHALDERKVDIISISFGWDRDDVLLTSLLSRAVDQHVLIFAATSNDGQEIKYPARSDSVFGVDAADSMGVPLSTNPSQGFHKARLTALGNTILSIANSNAQEPRVRRAGTSFATPVVAATAALLLEFAKQPPLSKSPGVLELLKQKAVMQKVLMDFCAIQKVPNFWHIDVHKTFAQPCRIAGVRDGGLWYEQESPRFEIARDIANIVQRQWGDPKSNILTPMLWAAAQAQFGIK